MTLGKSGDVVLPLMKLRPLCGNASFMIASSCSVPSFTRSQGHIEGESWTVTLPGVESLVVDLDPVPGALVGAESQRQPAVHVSLERREDLRREALRDVGVGDGRRESWASAEAEDVRLLLDLVLGQREAQEEQIVGANRPVAGRAELPPLEGVVGRGRSRCRGEVVRVPLEHRHDHHVRLPLPPGTGRDLIGGLAVVGGNRDPVGVEISKERL